jgi:hypothetical protein
MKGTAQMGKYTHNRTPNADMLGHPIEIGDIVVSGGASRNTTVAGIVTHVDATSISWTADFRLTIETFGGREISRRSGEVVVARATKIK